MVSYIVHQKSSETSVIRHRDSPILRAFVGLYSRALELTHIHATSPAQDDPQRHIPFTPITLYLRGSWFVWVLGRFSYCSRQLSASFWSPPRGVLVYNLQYTSKKNIYSTLRPASREVDLEQSRHHNRATEKLDRGRDPRRPIHRARPIQTGGFIFQLIRALLSFRY